MATFIYYPNGLLYLKTRKGKISWVADTLNARKFKDEQEASDFLERFKNDATLHGVPLVDLVITSADGEVLVSNHGFSKEDADTYLQQLPNDISDLCGIASNVNMLLNYYGKVLKQTDLETIDLLHKVEICNLGVVDGYKLYKQMQEVRKRRRVAKDSYEQINLLVESGLVSSLESLQKKSQEFATNLVRRKYKPRVLDGLFDGICLPAPTEENMQKVG